MADAVTLFLCGDVMLGRGIDQILPHPSPAVLYERYAHSAQVYLDLAERVNGKIARPAGFDYVWGDALAELKRRRPHARIINLETSITRSDEPWPKGINYRMHPSNVATLTAAHIDCCVLANNHVLDWGREGLVETQETLRKARIAFAGCGSDLVSSQAPAVLPLADGKRVLVFAAATDDAGVPAAWAASDRRSGVHRLSDLSAKAVKQIAGNVQRHRQPGDCVVFSVHWGDNWGYDIAHGQREFAHALIDEVGVNVIHGHSSHHPRAIEIYRDRPILYGCGDFINDYEGIEGHDEFRDELGLMYFPTLDAAAGRLLALELVPTRIRHFCVTRAGEGDRKWLLARLQRECRRFGCDVEEGAGGAFAVRWK